MISRPKSYLFTLLLTAGLGYPAVAQDVPEGLQEDQCVVCHTDLEALPENFVFDNVHMRPRMSCAGCHGGDRTTDDEEIAHAGDFVGVPTAEAIPSFCGSCHSDINYMRQFQPSASTDQVSQYFTSAHGQALRQGDENVATCISCHTSHATLPASDGRSSVHPFNVPDMCNGCHGDAALMAEYGFRTNQYGDFVESVHGTALLERQDIGAPACNDCHGNHGAMPPGIQSIENVCGMCHVNNAEFFESTPMAVAFAEEGLHACEECHGIHDVAKTFDDMVGVGDESVCTMCHDEGDRGYEVADSIHAQLVMLKSVQDSAQVLLERVQNIGMDDVEISYSLRDANESLIQARTAVHSFEPEKTGELTDKGVESARAAMAMANEEIEGFRFRRFGFGIATLFITVLTVALFFKIREIESSRAS
ncbi:MAG: cytochrome c3 family protein [Rhodothermia bacterium]|nr:cytochrome c3 family protein [Rhodothermia bacterium]